MPNEISEAESVANVAAGLIGQYHPELATATIKYLFQEKAGKKGGKPVLGTVRKVSGILEYYADCNFIMVIGLDMWNELGSEPQKRIALVDHLLERCTGEEDSEDPAAAIKWSLREPDVNEFSTILKRHGSWTEGLQGFCDVVRSIEAQYETVEPTVNARSNAQTSVSATAH